MKVKKGKAIVVTSGKGGTGKTTTVGALASCLASLGYKTLCLDCDVGLKNLDLSLGLADRTIYDFTDCLDGRKTLKEAMIAHPRIKNLYFLSAPTGIRPENIDKEKMAEFIENVKSEFDYCLVDSPAGLGAGFELASSGADMAIIVATGDASSIRDGQRASAELVRMGIKKVRLLVNRVKPRLFKISRSNVDNIIDSVGAQLIGLISEDEAVILSSNLEIPLVLYSKKRAAKQFMNVAKRITGKRVPIGKV